jgi:hypothetical protein
VRYTTEEGQVRASRLDKHRRVKGILFAHSVTTDIGERSQALLYETIKVNPKLSPKEITSP